MDREQLRRLFNEMLSRYRETPNFREHEIISENYPCYTIRSGDSGNTYEVNLQDFSCTCPGFRNWGRCKHILFVIQNLLEGRLEVPQEAEIQTLRDISRYIQGYHGGACGNSRTLNIPIRGYPTYGFEIEIKFRDYTTRLGDAFFDAFLSQGGVVERDASVDLEFKSPVLTGTGLLEFALNPFWKRVEELQDKNYKKQGVHVHIGWDSLFAVGKRPKSLTLKFLNRMGAKLESTFNFKRVFGRKPNNYCQLIANDSNYFSRYRWLNLRPLCREAGKTLEIRGFFSRPTNLLEIAFKARYISLALEKALRKWRADGCPNPDSYDLRFKNILSATEFKLLCCALELVRLPNEPDKRLKLFLRGLGLNEKEYKYWKTNYQRLATQAVA
jgi:hypothetical protein